MEHYKYALNHPDGFRDALLDTGDETAVSAVDISSDAPPLWEVVGTIQK